MTRLTLLLVATAASLSSACRPEPAPERLNLLLITLDTTRRDAIAPYNRNANTPNLATFARDAVVFDDAYSAANVTNPSHTSILTGLPAIDHGLFDNYDRLDEAVDTIPRALQRQGYTTAFVPAIAHLWRAFEGNGFDVTVTTPGRRAASDVVARAVTWLDQRPPHRPFFLWAHFFDAHTPYEPDTTLSEPLEPTPYLAGAPSLASLPFFSGRNRAMAGWLQDWSNPAYPTALYAGAVTTIDHHLGTLFERMRALGLDDSTVVVITADHGESLTEHGILFAHTGLYQPQIQVPLMIRAPGIAARVVTGRVSHLDIAPTLAELVPFVLEHPTSGRPLLTLIDGKGGSSGHPVVVESTRNAQVAALDGSHKVIFPISPPPPLPTAIEAFDLLQDPAELSPIELEDQRLRQLAAMSRRWRERGKAESASVVDDATRRELEALGYVR